MTQLSALPGPGGWTDDLGFHLAVLNPVDWARMLKSKAAGSGEYFSQGPFTVQAKTIWGVPAIPSPVMPQGKVLIGDFGYGATLLVREGVVIRTSDSDQDDFSKGRVSVLGEMRATVAIWRPGAFACVHLAP